MMVPESGQTSALDRSSPRDFALSAVERAQKTVCINRTALRQRASLQWGVDPTLRVPECAAL